MAVLSDRSIREQVAAGRIVLDPYDESCVQPASVDLHLDRFFRVFLNHTMPVIDVKQDLSGLTQEVEVDADGVFVLHPGEFVLGSTSERIGVPSDLVARVEGKSSLGRLGLLIHSSLPASETILFLDDEGLRPVAIGDVVTKQRSGFVVSFDPDTFEVGFAEVTGWYEGPPDRIFEVELASGRRVQVTAGHNLFTLDHEGEIRKVRTGELSRGARVALPSVIPDPASGSPAPTIDVATLVPESDAHRYVVEGPTIAAAIAERRLELADGLRSFGIADPTHHLRRGRLPLLVARTAPGLLERLTADDRIGVRGGRNGVPAVLTVDRDLAWLLGLYVAEGHRRRKQFTLCNTDQAILDRAARVLDALGLTYHRTAEQIVCGSSVGAELLGWLGTGDKAPRKRIPPVVFGWSSVLIAAVLEGIVDGDGSTDGGRTSVWTTSPGLVADLLVAFQRLGRRAGSCPRPARGNARPSWQVYAPDGEHKLLTSVPLPHELLIAARESCGLTQAEASVRAGYRHPSDLNNIERRTGRDAVRRRTLRRLRDAYVEAGLVGDARERLDRLVDGDLSWDEVVAVHDTGRVEPVYDLEVRPSGRKIENFVAGSGVFVSNTAGFIDPGFDGHITLELSNVANLPITLYPGMKIGQISFLEMTTAADVPYGSGPLGSKYQGQRGPTPSRYWENFRT